MIVVYIPYSFFEEEIRIKPYKNTIFKLVIIMAKKILKTIF